MRFFYFVFILVLTVYEGGTLGSWMSLLFVSGMWSEGMMTFAYTTTESRVLISSCGLVALPLVFKGKAG